MAYSLKVVPRGAKLKTAVGDVSMDGAAVLMSARKNAPGGPSDTFGDEKAHGVAYIGQPDSYPLPDDYQFCAPVNDVKESELGGIPVWRFRGTVMRVHDGSQEVHIDIYATREAMWDGVAPVLGDEVSGVLWLQGGLAPL